MRGGKRRPEGAKAGETQYGKDHPREKKPRGERRQRTAVEGAEGKSGGVVKGTRKAPCHWGDLWKNGEGTDRKSPPPGKEKGKRVKGHTCPIRGPLHLIVKHPGKKEKVGREAHGGKERSYARGRKTRHSGN